MSYICLKCGKRLTFEEVNNKGITPEEYHKERAIVNFRCPDCSSKTLFKVRPKSMRTFKVR